MRSRENLPLIEPFDASFSLPDVFSYLGGAEVLSWVVSGKDLDPDFDHVDGLDEAGGDHARNSSDSEVLEHGSEGGFRVGLLGHLV